MELQRAIDKPPLGYKKTPILCLVHEDNLEGLSSMVRGINPDEENVDFELKTYKSLEEAKSLVFAFLARRV